MKKDVVVAILVGFLLGVVVALTASNLPKIIGENLKKSKALPIVSPTPLATSTSILEFAVEEPKDESVSDSKTLSITGLTRPNQTVVLASETDHDVLTADSSGRFASKLDLIEGVNRIYITVYDAAGNSAAKTLNIYYTTEKL